MELNYDWKSFQRIFIPKKRSSVLANTSISAKAFVVMEGGCAISAYCDGSDVSGWTGKNEDTIRTLAGNRELTFIERPELDSWLASCKDLPHFHSQRRALRRKHGIAGNEGWHFLLDATNSWWGRILPSNYGIFIMLDNNEDNSILAIIRRGELHTFHKPDFPAQKTDRQRHPSELVKFLSDKYAVPVQGLMAKQEDWDCWSSDSNPWRLIAKAVRSSRARMVPLRWPIAIMMSFRAFFGL
ncbi:MAG: hypothetical protein A2583_15755 [Bdellovibrionales bacterium RIFOXYD1_FULL_53_11]|nr:MAG: hypothetical protein A2583_15755 [Bdellovibrionales bacterium RIFOXYD1_FULL_53_11]